MPETPLDGVEFVSQSGGDQQSALNEVKELSEESVTNSLVKSPSKKVGLSMQASSRSQSVAGQAGNEPGKQLELKQGFRNEAFLATLAASQAADTRNLPAPRNPHVFAPSRSHQIEPSANGQHEAQLLKGFANNTFRVHIAEAEESSPSS